MQEQSPAGSPRWSTNTKLLAAATLLIVTGAALVRFWHIITPLLVALIVAYLLHPVASFFKNRLSVPWAASVTGIYVVTIAAIIALLTFGGFELAPQIVSLIGLLETTLEELPAIIESLSLTQITIGPFVLSAENLPLGELSNQLVAAIQPLLGQTGSVIASFAGGAISTLGWVFFVVFVSYFLLIESGGISGQIVNINFPGYEDDIREMGTNLNRIWNRFLRGQITLFLVAVAGYTVLLTVLGVRYAFGLALVAGLARFLPYVGPLINWILLGIVTYFQEFKLFGLSPLGYTALVIGLAVLFDQILDNVVSPRLMSKALKVHPAAVLVAVLIAADLLGLIGVVIAAPILATVQLFSIYTLRKLTDKDPFPPDEIPPPERSLRARLRLFFQGLRTWLKRVTSRPS
jgi:predicted PurR-regulated permease PerM